MKRIIFLSDVLFHSPDYAPAYHRWVMNLIEPAIKAVTGHQIQNQVDLLNASGDRFDRKQFFALSQIYDISNSYYSYDISKISTKSWKYLFSFINKQDLIIGVELGEDLCAKLTSRQIIYINFWFHSFHLFDDSIFMLSTNNQHIYNKLLHYQIPREKFELYATITKHILQPRALRLQIQDNCCLFIGQTFADKSINKDGIFLNICNFEERIEELSKKYSKIYYIPHPSVANKKHTDIDAFIEHHPYIERLANVPTYVLLSSPCVKKVVGISSSVLYEAQFFGKEVEYLWKPLFKIDEKKDSFISIYHDYFESGFWKDILAEFFEIRSLGASGQVLFDKKPNALRYISNSWHGYKYIDPLIQTTNKTAALQRELDKFIHLGGAQYLFKKFKSPYQSIYYFLGIPVYKRTQIAKTKEIYLCGIKVLVKTENQ